MARLSFIVPIFCAVVLVVAAASPARADLVLTPTGTADGFTLTEFVGGYTSTFRGD